MDKKDDLIIICSKKNDAQTIGVPATCRKCGTPIWISDTTIDSIKQNHPNINISENPPVALCIECGLKQMDSMEAPVITPLTDLQLEELRNGISGVEHSIKMKL